MFIKVNIKRLIISWMIGLCLLSLSNSFAQYIDDEDAFFSYRRFYSQLDILENASRDKYARADIKAFMRNLADGIRAISAGEPGKARAGLFKAREIWPEYFGTDFLLARVSEDTGDYALSAKFYKSYLNKLKAFSRGNFRISGPLMRGITPYRIENYSDAYTSIEHRLKERGVDLAAVQPFTTLPRYLKYMMMFAALGLAYFAVTYRILPYIRRKRHINNPPEGYWACNKCDAYNLNVRLECEKCGEKYDKMLKEG